jgi:c(7)-type cytochrome triheme protein
MTSVAHRGPRRAAAWALVGLLACAAAMAAEFGDTVFTRKVEGMDDIPPAVFPHWVHRMQYKCAACHEEPFKMKAGTTDVTMEAIDAGQTCGLCHDGKTAFKSTVDTCVRCHYK